MEVIKGRMYDYNNGRFLSVDPFIQSPTSTQSMNPYTYIFNNPLSGTDPTGYIVKKDDDITITKTERVSITGSHIKGTKTTGVNQSGEKFSVTQSSTGEVVASNGIDWSTSKGPSTDSGKGNSDTGKQSSFFGKVGVVSKVFVDNYSEIVQGAVNGAIDQATSEEGKKAAIIGAELAIPVPPLLKLKKYAPAVFKSLANWLKALNLGANSGKGFKTFNALKKELGVAGEGRAWHHIVEQTPANIKKFGSGLIQNTRNVVNVPHGKGLLHQKISGFYSSIQPFTKGQTVRKWLSSKSFKEQQQFGLKTLKRFTENTK